MATEISTSIAFAVKILDKQQIIKERKAKYVNTEKTILNMLKHPNVVQLFYTFQDESSLCILLKTYKTNFLHFSVFVLELCSNGELYDHLKKVMNSFIL